jgi:hypothetical protein
LQSTSKNRSGEYRLGGRRGRMDGMVGQCHERM